MCDFDEERPPQPVASSASAAPLRALSAAEMKEAAGSSDGEDASPAVAVFSGTGRRIKGESGAVASSAPDAAAVSRVGSAVSADPPALCWKLQFHWYDGQQDKVKPNPTAAKDGAEMPRVASEGSAMPSARAGGSAASAPSGPARTKSDGALMDAAADPFKGAAHSLKHKKT